MTEIVLGILICLLIVALISFVWLYWPLPWQNSRKIFGKRQVILREGRRIMTYAQGEGLRVVLVASVGRSVSDFNELAMGLVEAGFRTLAVEAPACRGSDPMPEGASLYDLAYDVIAAIIDDETRVQCEASIGVGHGFGHRVVRAASTLKPGLIKACILLGPGSHTSLTGPDAEHFRQCFNPWLPVAARVEHIHEIFFSRHVPVPAHWRRGWHWVAANIQGRASVATLDSDWKKSGDGPVLLIQGANDRIAPHKEVAASLREELGAERLELMLVPRSGHVLLPEQPLSIVRIITDFLNQSLRTGR